MLQTTPNPLLKGEETRDPRRRMTRESAKALAGRMSRQGNALDHLGDLPTPGAEVVLIMDGTYHGWDLVNAILEKVEGPADLHIATLGFNARQARNLGDLIDSGKIASVTMAVSEMFREKNKREYKALADELEARGQKIAAGRNHAKIVAFHFKDTDTRIVLHGSLNLRSCNAYEQVMIANCPALYDFVTDFIESLV